MPNLKLSFLTLIAIASTGIAVGFQATPPPAIRVVIFGTAVDFPDQQPIESNGRILVPLRGVFERLGASVDWDPSTQTISARRRDVRVKLAVGQLDASVNDRDVHLDVAATLVGGSTMVPLRFVGEAFGANVSWNSFQQEVGITQGSDYHIPQPSPHPSAPPPAKVIIRTITKTVPTASRPSPPPVFDVIPEDSVLPFKLNNRLNSYDAQVADPFTATLETSGQSRYADLPAGTQVYGRVGFVRPHSGDEPGMIELQFDRMVTPGGHSILVTGRLIGLDGDSVIHGKHGVLIAKSSIRSQRVLYTGYSPGVGIIVGLHGKHAIADLEIGGLVGHTVSREVQHRQTGDVQLVPGTRFGLRLHQDLTMPRGIQ
jgi:hypothetical protein